MPKKHGDPTKNLKSNFGLRKGKGHKQTKRKGPRENMGGLENVCDKVKGD